MGLKLTACTFALMMLYAILDTAAARAYKIGYTDGIVETTEMLFPVEQEERR